MCGAGVWSAIKRFGCTLERPLSRTIWPFSAGPWLHAVNQRGGEFVIRIFDSSHLAPRQATAYDEHREQVQKSEGDILLEMPIKQSDCGDEAASAH